MSGPWQDFSAHRQHMGISERYAGPGCCLRAEGVVYWQRADLRARAAAFNTDEPGIVGPAENGWVRSIEARGNVFGDRPKYIYLAENVTHCPACGRDITDAPKPPKAPGRAPVHA